MSLSSLSSSSSPSSSSSSSSSSAATTHETYSRTAGAIRGKLSTHGQYTVTHKWRKIDGCNLPGAPHHSHIFVTSQFGEAYDFGLFSGEKGKVVFEPIEEDHNNPFRISTSYEPNEVMKSGEEIEAAFHAARAKCGWDYNFLTNNCQKFAREFMIALGSTHKRQFFHP
jgi:hypothetical protein